MRLSIVTTHGFSDLIIDDCCEHDLAMIQTAMQRYHTRWLRRRKPQTVEIVTAKGRYVFLVRDISSVSLEAD